MRLRGATTSRNRFARGHIGAVGALVALLLAFSALVPAQAQAFPDIGDMVDKAVGAIFGVDGDWISGTFLQWLIKIENPGIGANPKPAVVELEGLTRDVAFAALAAVLTLSVIHYWAAGVAGGGSGAGLALDGVIYTTGAALFILAWPWLFDNGIALAHSLNSVLVSGDQLDLVAAQVAGVGGLGASLGGGIPLLFAIVVIVAFVLVVLAVFVTKIVLSAALVVLVVGMPIGLAMWPIPGLRPIPTRMLQACAAITLTQVGWALCLAAYAAIGVHALSFTGGGAFVDKLVRPLAMLGMLVVMLKVPGWLQHAMGLSTSGGGMLGRITTLVAVRGAFGALGGRGGTSSSANSPNANPPKVDPLAEARSELSPQQREAAAAYGAAKSVAANQRHIDKLDRELGREHEKFQAFLANPAGGVSGGPGGQGRGGRPGGGRTNPGGLSHGTGGGNGATPPRRTRVAADGLSTQPRATPAERRNTTQMIEGLRSHGNFARGPGAVERDLDALRAAGPVQTPDGPRDIATPLASFLTTHGSTEHGDPRTVNRLADAWLSDGMTDAHRGPLARIAAQEPTYRGVGGAGWLQRNSESDPGPATPATPPTGGTS